ncbi:MAG TPA: glycosyltransferase [Saprospiraceae bacterium]|nr:glycosyltransferase [Saprospiraceae bacterium]HPN71781.1 glycosyltransferase [Saprospiraceae bacterium]
MTPTIKQIPFGKTIVVAPLNWGLGHASRCIPLINQALNQNNKVIIASDGIALNLLRKEFPNLKFYELPSYDIKYPFPSILFNLIWQSPRILRTIRTEKKAISDIIEVEKVDLLISDNRYGCLSLKCESVFITHQLFIQTNNVFTSLFANLINDFLLRNHSAIWVPDFEGKGNLAGMISQVKPKMYTGKISYIGPLSRISMCDSDQHQLYDVICLLSGPEPQRTKFEQTLVEILKKKRLKVKLVRGTTLPYDRAAHAHIKVIDVATTAEIQEDICQTKWVIARSGYSTVMDLYSAGKQGILVPTPGQIEQEHLAKHLSQHPQFKFIQQNELNEKNLTNLLKD